jgi:DNA-binding MarR family transcriptional regulator
VKLRAVLKDDGGGNVRGKRGAASMPRSDEGEDLNLSPCRSRSLAVVSDTQFSILNHLFVYGKDNLTNIARALNKDRRRVYDSLKRLVERCFVEKDGKLYRLTELGLKMLSRARVVNLSKNREEKNNIKSSQGKAQDTSPHGRCGGSVGYVGRYFDNVRGYVGSSYVQSGRDVLVSGLAGFDRLSYFEITHLVRGFVVEGVVVVYTNEGDLGWFDDCVARVEWRPPEGVVGSNPPASVLRLGRFEFTKAFKALSIVLGELLLPDDLADLYAWLGRRWGLVGCERWPG